MRSKIDTIAQFNSQNFVIRISVNHFFISMQKGVYTSQPGPKHRCSFTRHLKKQLSDRTTGLTVIIANITFRAG